MTWETNRRNSIYTQLLRLLLIATFGAVVIFFVFDFNGEYSSHNSIIPDSDKKVYKLSTRKTNGDKIPLADDDFLDINLLSIFSNATEKTQRPFIARSIDLYKKIDKDENKFRNFLKKE